MIIETPAIVLDMRKIKKNISRMQEMADMLGLKLRPHIKTHKMPELAKLQVSRGAAGITCASLSEAECMAEHGLHDIFIAYPVIGKNKLERLLDLMEKARIITGVDSREGAAALSDAAGRRGVTAEVRIEIDTGMRRTGVHWEKAAELAVYVASLPNIKLTGIFTFKSSVLNEEPTTDNAAAAREENGRMAFAAKQIAEAGVKITNISGGSTPTAQYCGEDKALTEFRPGSYIFGDVMRINTGAVKPADCAATVAVTVVSAPCSNRAIIDGGAKAFSGDAPLNNPPLFIKGHGLILGHQNLEFIRMSEEHGVIETKDGSPTNLQIGQILQIIPNHTCTCINLFDHAYIINEDTTVRKEKIAARGMSQ
ncbi:MAG: alanine racemase [Defluviitaleaceae bacterium]|nr:alanine racemase [Defluviitaleaceae bacterium]MCL2837050.1 alanine racemase [Defluviitaleaceae bacterium]